ncbi:MAG: BREX system Lon protease-like protein BrxL [Anaerolineae bacterium]|nr:BREX system Lon protease-like protein BrxL [Anaerolineae bacterium]
MLETFEQKALDYYGDVIINKYLLHEAGFGARAIPTYVGEWILSNFVQDGELTQESRERIAAFLGKYLPSKGQKDEIKNRLLKMDTVQLLDDFSVSVNLKSGQRQLRIPLLDLNDANIGEPIVDANPLLVSSGVWGIGTLFYVPPDGPGDRGQVWMREFRPFQVSTVDSDYFKTCRQHFTFDEWLDLMVSSIGFNPRSQTLAQKMILITRIIPLAEPRVNLVELAPKGTGKSFVYDNLSRYGRVIAGGKISPAVLFHNLANQMPGLITRYDVIVLDEVQSISGDSTGELIAGLKVYLESGRFSRGNTMGTSEAGFVMLGNLTLDERHQPIYTDQGLFQEIPNFLQETAFIDRIHGLIAGWEMGRVTKDTPSHSMGFKGDFFSEILHVLRRDAHFSEFVTQEMRLVNCNDLRDRKAITRLATGYLKLLFPDLQPTEEEFREHCVRPAVALRQRVRDELHKLDPEYAKVEIGFE